MAWAILFLAGLVRFWPVFGARSLRTSRKKNSDRLSLVRDTGVAASRGEAADSLSCRRLHGDSELCTNLVEPSPEA